MFPGKQSKGIRQDGGAIDSVHGSRNAHGDLQSPAEGKAAGEKLFKQSWGSSFTSRCTKRNLSRASLQHTMKDMQRPPEMHAEMSCFSLLATLRKSPEAMLLCKLLARAAVFEHRLSHRKPHQTDFFGNLPTGIAHSEEPP